MYWTEWANSGSIERAWLDGSQREVLLSGVGRTNGLTIDCEEYRLYWAGLTIPAIESYDFNTNRRKTIVSENVGYPFSATQYKDYIYWTDWKTGSIERANKTTGANRTTIHEHLESVTDLLVFHASRQSGRNKCATSNNGCSHFCIALPGIEGTSSKSYKCACPTHYNLASDNKTCFGKYIMRGCF